MPRTDDSLECAREWPHCLSTAGGHINGEVAPRQPPQHAVIDLRAVRLVVRPIRSVRVSLLAGDEQAAEICWSCSRSAHFTSDGSRDCEPAGFNDLGDLTQIGGKQISLVVRLNGLEWRCFLDRLLCGTAASGRCRRSRKRAGNQITGNGIAESLHSSGGRVTASNCLLWRKPMPWSQGRFLPFEWLWMDMGCVA